VVFHQAPQRRPGCQAGKDLYQIDQGNYRGCPDGWGRSGRQPAAAHGRCRRQNGKHAQGQHRARHQKGTGELEGVSYEENSYEGYGPGGAAILVESLTDNKNRAVAEIRHIFNKYGGNMGENGCVAWMFDNKGYFNVDKAAVDEDKLMEIALEAGAEDVRDEGDSFEVITAPEDFDTVKDALEGADIPFSDAEVTMLPQNMSPLEGKEAERMLKLMDAMDDCDDVQKVYTNADIPDDMVDAM
jgi:YebC/PmpR family DNA-binding regulatory protein